MAMRLPSINGQSLFTVEQIELIRRLRNSGLSKDQIVNAFDSLERLDRELGHVYNIPISQVANVANAVTFQQLQVQASQVANQVASQLAQVAQVAQVAKITSVPHAATTVTGAVVGGQPVFPRPIAIAPSLATANTQQIIPIPLSSSTAAANALTTTVVATSNVITSTTATNNTPLNVSGQNGVASPQPTIRIKTDRKRSHSDDTKPESPIASVLAIVKAQKAQQNLINSTSPPPPSAETTKHCPPPLTAITNPGSPINGNGLSPGGPASCGAASPGSSSAGGDLKLDGIPEISDTSEDYLNFIAKGERPCCEEIKDFVQKYNIRQQQIATLSGISQPYVSRFLRGEFSEMSPRSRRTIMKWYIQYKKHPTAIGVCQSYVSRFLRGEVFDMSGRSRQSIIKWYLSYKSNPNSIAPAVNAVLMLNGHPPAKKFISSLDVTSGDFVNAPRRERFVFRPNHVAILEKCFQEDSYPSYQKREEIARTLNATTEASTGKELEEREIVTAQIISNWFANKRKEMKKIAREAYFKSQGLTNPGNLCSTDIDLEHIWEGLDVSQVPLRPRGRPSGRFFLSMMGGQEQATDLSINSQSTNLTLANNNNDHVATDLSLSNCEEATDLTVNNNNHEADDLSDGNMSTPDLQDVELAAVNQAILSLTGQQPISIKMEKSDDKQEEEGEVEEEEVKEAVS